MVLLQSGLLICVSLFLDDTLASYGEVRVELHETQHVTAPDQTDSRAAVDDDDLTLGAYRQQWQQIRQHCIGRNRLTDLQGLLDVADAYRVALLRCCGAMSMTSREPTRPVTVSPSRTGQTA